MQIKNKVYNMDKLIVKLQQTNKKINKIQLNKITNSQF